MSAIVAANLSKSYVVPVREAGLKAAVSSLFNRQTREVKAVEQVTFTVEPGELVGLLGPNGAGKTTTLKMLSGLLHRPKVLFLDEPTIGLDVTMQRRIRKFVQVYNRRYGASVILTSHYMADVEALCERVIVIHHGRILFDGALAALVERFSGARRLVVTLDYMLTKPENAQLLVSVRELQFWQMVDVITGLVVMGWGLRSLQAGVTAAETFTNRSNLLQMGFALGLTAVIFTVSHFIWKRGLRRYASASA